MVNSPICTDTTVSNGDMKGRKGKILQMQNRMYLSPAGSWTFLSVVNKVERKLRPLASALSRNSKEGSVHKLQH